MKLSHFLDKIKNLKEDPEIIVYLDEPEIDLELKITDIDLLVYESTPIGKKEEVDAICLMLKASDCLTLKASDLF